MVSLQYALEYGAFYENICALYRERTNNRNKNDHVMRKSLGNIA
jgi:hypothetical protein